MNDKRHTIGKEPSSPVLKRELNTEQRLTLAELEKFGWELKFIRRPLFQQPVPVVSRFRPEEICRVGTRWKAQRKSRL